MDFMKVIDQTVCKIKSEVNLKVLKVPEIEKRCTGTRPLLGASSLTPVLSSQPLCLTLRFQNCSS
ncbi:unnamed protein product [Camellia sinensis]